ncbi:Spx/MgsR family RNA polymerase-binding regulatory protein [Poriferisphaera sp. WC338]|uniref:Spx/MgsR family RNA polymerase-binding regulatory protein n=1 Tax=Poriferisphaera sp. WC338 TaxID=3425129 RepID=UPI003D817EE0
MLTLYGYNKCSTCRNAKKYLDQHGLNHTFIDITEQPPPQALLKAILKAGDYQLKDLFNKSGVQYRELNMKDKLPNLSEAEALKLLTQNGKLCKRPIITNGKKYTVGYKEDVMKAVWGS